MMKTRKGGFSHPPVPPFSYWLRLEFFFARNLACEAGRAFFYIYIYIYIKSKKIAKKIALFYCFTFKKKYVLSRAKKKYVPRKRGGGRGIVLRSGKQAREGTVPFTP